MFIWVISRKYTKLCAVIQIVTVITMNIIEFFLTPDLLLFGRFNIVISLIFVFIIYLNEFKIKPKIQ